MTAITRALEDLFSLSAGAGRAKSHADWEDLCHKTLEAILDALEMDYAAFAVKIRCCWQIYKVATRNGAVPDVSEVEELPVDYLLARAHSSNHEGIIHINKDKIGEPDTGSLVFNSYSALSLIPIKQLGETVAVVIGLSTQTKKIPQALAHIAVSMSTQLAYMASLQKTAAQDLHSEPFLFSEKRELEDLCRAVKGLKKEKEELQKENQSLSRILRALGAGLSIIDKNMKVVWVNELMERWFGPSRNLIGNYCFKSYMHGEDVCQDCPTVVTFKTGQTQHVEREETSFKNQEERVVDIITTPIIDPETESVVQVLCLIQDITKKKKSEDELRFLKELHENILESANIGIAVVNKDLKILRCNSLMQELWQLKSKDRLSSHLLKSLDKNESEEFSRWVSQVMEQAQPMEIHNLISQKANGECLHSNLKISPLRDKDGQIYGAILLQENITELKRLEEKLIQSEKLRALGQMASGVAHNLNNVLAIIKGNIQLLLERIESQEIREELRIAEKATRDGAQTIRRLLDFTCTRKDSQFYQLDLNEVVKDAIEITKPKWKDQSQRKGISIDLRAELSELPPVAGNASELREVMTNLIFNSVEAMPVGGRILIETKAGYREVYIIISDTGTGIPPENKTRVFDPFFTTKGPQNTGLGLSASYGIVCRHRGKIELHSLEGEGAAFMLTIPESDGGSKPLMELTEITGNKRGNILIIDDEVRVGECLSGMLRKTGHSVVTALNAREGWEAFNREKFDMVFTDLGMPGMSGRDLAGLIKQMSPAIPVVMMTGWNEEIAETEEKGGIDFYVSKPFEMGKIISLVDKIMNPA